MSSTGRGARAPAWLRLAPRVAVVLLALSVVVLAVALSARPTRMEAATPADRAMLEVAPAAVTLTFSQPLDPRDTHVGVFDPRDAAVHAAEPTINRATVTQPVTIRAPGTYRVRYHVGLGDGRTLSGALSFTVVASADQHDVTGANGATGPRADASGGRASRGGHGHTLDAVTSVVLGLNAIAVAVIVAAVVRRRRSTRQT